MTGRPSTIDDNELRRLVARGMGRNQIAKHFRCTPNYAGVRLRRLRLVAPTDGAGRMADPANLPKVSIERTRGAVSLPGISMFIRAREEAKQ